MRQFKLLSQHYIGDSLLDAGTIIGEGTSVPFTYPNGKPQPPSDQMEGLNEESQVEVDAVIAKAYPLFADLSDTFQPAGPDPTATVVDVTDAKQAATVGEPKLKVK